MKNSDFEEISHRNSVPILSWDFHYEYVNELKAMSTDLKKVNLISNKFTWNEKNLQIKERIKEEVVLVTDLDLKIVFVSNGITRMTGYKEEEILGKTPKMFQGSATSNADLQDIKQAIEMQIPFKKTITNYKKNGDIYKCKIDAFPVFNLQGNLSHFIAFEKQDLSA